MITIVTEIATMRTTNTPATSIVVAMLLVDVGSVIGGTLRHSPSLRDEIATEHCGSTLISIPVTMILAPPLTQSSIKEMREPLSVSVVPSSLARYVTYVWDSEEQVNDRLSMMSLVMTQSVQESVN